MAIEFDSDQNPTKLNLIQHTLSVQYTSYVKAHVRFGSKAGMNRSNRDVRFTPESGHC
jgi:hypothetical protein